MSDHTKGRWRFDDLAPLVTIYTVDVATDSSPTVCVVGDGDTDYSLDANANELVANVSLIAAAPDLLDALINCAERAHFAANHSDEFMNCTTFGCRRYSLVILKAEGRAA